MNQLLKMAPNVKDVGFSLYYSTINLDIVDELANRLTVFPRIELDRNTDVAFTQKWLEKTTILETVAIHNHHLSSIDFSKLKPIPSVKQLEFNVYFYHGMLKELFRVFPCVEVFRNQYLLREGVKNTLVQSIKEGKWPNLRQGTVSLMARKDLIKLRPHLAWDIERVRMEEDPFEKWL